MGDKVATDQLCPDSLFQMSLRVFAKDIHKIEPSTVQCLPNSIKRIILKYVTGYLSQTRRQGLRNTKTIKALLNSEVIDLELRDSATTDSILHSISGNCGQLRELTLGGPYYHVKRKTLQNFIPKMKCLTFLCLKDVANVTDKSIRGLTELEHLKHLNLQNCVNLTDGCGKILRNLKLEKLNISYNNISDQWVNELANSPLNEHLIDLNLSHCRAVSSDSLKLLNWSKLKYIGLLGIDEYVLVWRLLFRGLWCLQLEPNARDATTLLKISKPVVYFPREDHQKRSVDTSASEGKRVFGWCSLDFLANLGKLKFVQWTIPF